MAMNPRARRRRAEARKDWPGAGPSAAGDPRRPRRRPAAPPPRRPGATGGGEAGPASTLDAVLDDFTESWGRGERPRAEGYLALLAPADSAELIYHEYCLAEASGLGPDPAEYLGRFPGQAGELGRLFALHGALPASVLRDWAEATATGLPASGDEIGPYRLLRELGRGAFARVFLAEQADLDHRLVVVKVSTRATAEPRLLARARHAHIVEVLRHAAADDGALQLVCMPFLGGATLAAALEGRRGLGRRARSGLDLLADLDRVSAPEHPGPGPSRPAREVVAGLSYAGALAWVAARLAEALDHAHRRGVAHGDIKPSNILLTADATPMLFDFNLAVDRREAGPGGGAAEGGGTPAYMAPERLRALAGPAGGGDGDGRAVDPHRADLYALGLVLLESLTGRPPEVPRPREGAGPRELAALLARSRRGLPGALRGGAPGVPRALRPILARALAPDPADRYARGAELAEDLDRWRADLPPAFAGESRRSGLARRARRRRPALVAGVLTLAAALAAGAVASALARGSRRDQAMNRLSMVVGRADSGAFVLQEAGHWRPDEHGDPAENAARQLARYDAEADADWRARDDVRSLPDREREETEAWICEQVLRRAVALGDRPGSPEDWRRALDLVDRAVARSPLAALRLEGRKLRARLGLPEPEAGPADAPRPPRWIEDYLAGVAAEPLHAREAMGHYLDALRDRPEMFWAHYRVAAVAARIDEFPIAVEHLRRCVGRQPGNPALHALLASTLYHLERDEAAPRPPDGASEAARACDRALALDPDLAEAHRVRALIRQSSGQDAAAGADVDRFGVLTRFDAPARALMVRAGLAFHPGPNYRAHPEAVKDLTRRALAARPDDHEARAVLAAGLAWDGRDAEAVSEYDRVLAADPGHLRARYQRAAILHRQRPGSAAGEFASLIDHPRFEEVFREEPAALRAFHHVATDRLGRGRIDEALEVTHRALGHVQQSRSLRNATARDRLKASGPASFSPRGETFYLLARIHAVAAGGDRAHLAPAVDYLDRAFAAHEGFRDVWYARDRRFDGLRGEIDGRLAAR